VRYRRALLCFALGFLLAAIFALCLTRWLFTTARRWRRRRTLRLLRFLASTSFTFSPLWCSLLSRSRSFAFGLLRHGLLASRSFAFGLRRSRLLAGSRRSFAFDLLRRRFPVALGRLLLRGFLVAAWAFLTLGSLR
jgi:hypothetical protein